MEIADIKVSLRGEKEWKDNKWIENAKVSVTEGGHYRFLFLDIGLGK